jgi:hypothetical protein
MVCYTLSNCLLENLDAGKVYISDILMVFTQQNNPFKVALDKSDRIMDLYQKAGEKDYNVAYWLTLMSYKPSSFEIINVDTSSSLNEEEVFLSVCSKTKSQQKMIVYSHEGWQYYGYSSANVVHYNDIPVQVYDRDEAIRELNTSLAPKSLTTIYATDSVIAADHSSISETKN